MIIGISGKSASGKDTLASIIMGSFPEKNFKSVAFASNVKVIGAVLLDKNPQDFEIRTFKESWLDDMNISVREMLQAIGDGLREKIHPDVWIKSLARSLKPDQNYIITDVRYQNEADMIKEQGGMVVLVDRYTTFNEWSKLSFVNKEIDDDTLLSKDQYLAKLKSFNSEGMFNNELRRLNHSTEHGMDGYEDYDFIINNTTIGEFHHEVIQMADRIKNG